MAEDPQPGTLALPSFDKATVNALPLRYYEGPIQIINDDASVPGAVALLQGEKLLGFDTETRPCFRKGQSYPPALLQLAGESQVFLFQLLRLTDLSPVIGLLANPGIRKVGVAIRDDLRKLQEHRPFTPQGFVELARITQKAGILNTGLRNLTAILLGFRISKGAQVSNWAKTDLTLSQVRYAATDAWASRQVYLRLQQLGVASGAVDEEMAEPV